MSGLDERGHIDDVLDRRAQGGRRERFAQKGKVLCANGFECGVLVREGRHYEHRLMERSLFEKVEDATSSHARHLEVADDQAR